MIWRFKLVWNPGHRQLMKIFCWHPRLEWTTIISTVIFRQNVGLLTVGNPTSNILVLNSGYRPNENFPFPWVWPRVYSAKHSLIFTQSFLNLSGYQNLARSLVHSPDLLRRSHVIVTSTLIVKVGSMRNPFFILIIPNFWVCLGANQRGAVAWTAFIGLTQSYRLYKYSHASVEKVGVR